MASSDASHDSGVFIVGGASPGAAPASNAQPPIPATGDQAPASPSRSDTPTAAPKPIHDPAAAAGSPREDDGLLHIEATTNVERVQIPEFGPVAPPRAAPPPVAPRDTNPPRSAAGARAAPGA